MLFTYSNNVELARQHLEQCLTLSQQIHSGFDEIKFDAASTLSQLYQQQNQSNMAKTILRKAIENSQHNIYWHSKLLFQIAVSESLSKSFHWLASISFSVLASTCQWQRVQFSFGIVKHWCWFSRGKCVLENSISPESSHDFDHWKKIEWCCEMLSHYSIKLEPVSY